MHRFVEKLHRLAQQYEVTLAITPSRRTPKKVTAQLAAQFGRDHFVWTGSGENPYFVSLALASHIIATGDSVSMITEASATGKPLLVEHLTERRPAKRFRRFHAMFHEAGISRPFDGTLMTWSYEPPRDTQKVAAIIRERMNEP
jgi:hypothetical protein